MIRSHAEIEELLAVRSLGGLTGDDVERLDRQLASHGDCGECRRLADEYEETAGRLGFSLDPMPVNLQADEILHRATHPATQEVAPAPPTTPIDELRARRSRRPRAWPALVAAAAVVVLVVSGVTIFRSLRPAGLHLSTNQTVVSFSGDAGELAMAYQPGKPGALFVGSDFADPGSDKVYEIWMLQGDAAVSSGCVRPHDGSIVAFADVDLSDTDQMAVTVEPDSCPSQPTTTPILISDPLVA
jgi:anti-sigma-K factor RskA